MNCSGKSVRVNRQKKGITNMAHQDAGNYSAKHASDRKLNKEIAQAIEKKALKGEIACTDTEGIAIELNVPMGEVGIAIDLMEIRISKCQLGLFGYGPGKKAIKPVKAIPSELEKAIRSALVNGRLPCVVSWGVAQEFNISRMDVSSACEALEIKIKPCQLGAF
jgi:hypothetical protein